MLRSNGATNVVVSDLDEVRAQRAKQFGATHVSLDGLADLSNGRGADIVLDMSGSPDAMESSLELLRVGGRLILVGAVFPARPLRMQADQLVRKMLRVEGVHNYESGDLQTAVRFLLEAGSDFPFASLVDREFSLSDVNAAVQETHDSGAFRVAVRP